MSGDFPKFMWQREYNKKWTLYSYDEICIINKAVLKKQKSVSLPGNDPKKKIVINLDKMIQKNLVSGFEQRVRCLIFNGSHICWSWQGDYEEWISYGPHAAFILEVAHHKKMKTVDISLRDEYEVNLEQFIQVNKETQFERPVSREIIALKYPKEKSDSHLMMMEDDVASKELVQKAANDFDQFKNYMSGLPALAEGSNSSEIELPAVPEEIITALNAEVQPSTSTQLDANVAVDPECPEASNYVVYCEQNDCYNATLNFANLQDNNNKFFFIQLLKHVSKNKFAVWFHWGRVGYKGQCNLVNCGSNLDQAKSTFEKKFYDKTRNHWSERQDFQRVPSKYDLVHIELAPADVPISLSSAESKLDKRIQNLLEIICNRKQLEDAAKEMCYDASNTPLGKMTPKQILEGYDALNQITNIIKSKGKCRELIEANNNFYTKIPHDFGRKTPPLLCSLEQVKEKLKMLEDLSNIILAVDVLNLTGDGPENIVDKYYKSLDCNLIPLEHTSDEFKALSKCLLETQGSTHSTYTMELTDAFKCVKEAKKSSFLDFGNKKLLWHGSRISNWIGILKKGLQIAPPEAPSTGYMFGKGIYFADCSSKSANYCFVTKKKNEGMLLLSEVSLGSALTAYEADDYSKLPHGYHSVLGVGRIQPTKFETTVLSKEASVPFGPLEEKGDGDLTLNYNEYIVYNVHQVKMKYLLRIRFHF